MNWQTYPDNGPNEPGRYLVRYESANGEVGHSVADYDYHGLHNGRPVNVSGFSHAGVRMSPSIARITHYAEIEPVAELWDEVMVLLGSLYEKWALSGEDAEETKAGFTDLMQAYDKWLD